MTVLPLTVSSITGTTALRRTARWMVSFLGFPLGGAAAILLAGPVAGPRAALVGGLATGAVLGAVQAWAMGGLGTAAGRWIAATATGLAIGLALSVTAVGFATTLTALIVQGALTGFAVGTAQAVVLGPQLGRLALGWPPALAALWAAGWAVTTLFGIRVEEQFTVFGSSGALLVTAGTAVLPFILGRTEDARSASLTAARP